MKNNKSHIVFCQNKFQIDEYFLWYIEIKIPCKGLKLITFWPLTVVSAHPTL